jgi:hypothetical protein
MRESLATKIKLVILYILSLVLLALSKDLYEHGFSLGAACGFGFGKRQHVVQETAVRRIFLESLPTSIEVESVKCSGFTDLTLVATFYLSNSEANRLVARLEETFLSRQNHPIVGDRQKRRSMIGPPSYTKYIYFLPGSPLFDLRTVSVSIPRDADTVATVVFEGGNY